MAKRQRVTLAEGKKKIIIMVNACVCERINDRRSCKETLQFEKRRVWRGRSPGALFGQADRQCAPTLAHCRIGNKSALDTGSVVAKKTHSPGVAINSQADRLYICMRVRGVGL